MGLDDHLKRVGLAVLAAWAGLVGGCTTGPKGGPIRPPAVDAEVGHFVGTSLSGPQTDVPDDLGAGGVWAVTGRVLAVTRLPTEGFERIGPRARLVVAYRGPGPVSASTRLTSGVSMFVPADEQPIDTHLGDEKTREILGTFIGGVAEGTTASFSVGLPHIPQPTLEQLPYRTRAAVQISRPAGQSGYLLTVVGDDLVADTAASDSNTDARQNPLPTTINRELAVIGRTVSQGKDHFVIAVPFAFPDSNAAGLVYEISIEADPADDLRQTAMAALRSGAKTSAESARQTISTRPAGSPQQVLIRTAIESLARGSESTRGSINYIASQAGAALTGELALVADERMLDLLKQQILKNVGDGQIRDPGETALLLERASAEVLNAVRNSSSDSLSSAVLGTLDSYAGELGHQPDSLFSVIRQASTINELANRMIVENQIYLEDTSPPARVRAYDWLRSRNIELPGYDPLARGRERREALEKIRAATTTPTQP